MRVAVAQINTTVGDFAGNQQKIFENICRAHGKHCDLVVFPESTLFGYHPFDLLERKTLVDKQLKSLEDLNKKIPKGIVAVVGVITKNPKKMGKPYFNSAARLEKGKKIQFFNKQLLPTGDVFDEARFIENGDSSKNFFKVGSKTVYLTICEDIWAWPNSKGESQYKLNPLEAAKGKKIDLILNISASPFYPAKLKVRQELVKKTTALLKAPMIYCNMVGAQDEIIFDGASFGMDKTGKILMQSLAFEEDLNVIDLDKKEGGIRPLIKETTEQLRQALILGLKDFCAKSGLQKVHLGLSGGIDSAIVACLAVDALGPNNVKTFALPGPFSDEKSARLARQLAKNIGVEIFEIGISDFYQSLAQLAEAKFDVHEFSTVHENIQARIRGLILMMYSNAKNSLLITTCNKSELASGYATLYGDMCAGLMMIGDLTKGQVYNIARLYNQEHEVIPKEIIDRHPSAELKPNQRDQDTLPPYDKLDASVVKIVEDSGRATSETDLWLIQALMRSEFKRWQAPPILKVSKHSFGRGRRLPIAHKAKE